MDTIEKTIIANLLCNRPFTDKVIPYLKGDYFDGTCEKQIIELILTFNDKYQEPPSKEALEVLVDKIKNVNEKVFSEIKEYVSALTVQSETNQEWLLDATESFCKERALHNAIRDSIVIMDGQDKNRDVGTIPELVLDALSISFDTNIGHDYIEDSDERFEYYHDTTAKVQFDIDILNKVTNGGLPRKTLTMFMAPSGVGKSLILGHVAATCMMYGLNVLYVTLELAEKEIGKRVDANLLNTPINQLESLDKETYDKRIDRIRSKTPGKLIIKEYAPGSAHSGHFRFMIKELISKKRFIPDVLIFDYVSLISSARAKMQNANSYTLVKLATEDIRGLCKEFNCVGYSAGQVNRAGYNTTDVDATNTSDSMGIIHTADVVFGVVTSDEMEENGQLLWKQLKNRFGNIGYYSRFVTGVEKAKMRLYNCEETAQDEIIQNQSKKASQKNKEEDNPVMDDQFSPAMFGGDKKKLFNV